MASDNHKFSPVHLHPNYASPATGKSPIAAENYDNTEIDFEYFDSFPPGYRFCPTEAELVLYYLKRKVNGQKLPKSKIMDVNLYHYNPDKLAEYFKACGEKEWYFFTPRNKKYPNGKRPNRAAGEGYWKATGCDKEVKYEGEVVGYKRALVFYIGKAQKGEKTNWIMHEFRVVDAPVPQRNDQNEMKLDQWVLCRIHHKSDKSGNIPILMIQQIEDKEPEAAIQATTDGQMMIDATNHQESNCGEASFNRNMQVFGEDIHDVNNYNSNESDSNLQFYQQQFSFNMHESDLFADITAECASIDLHSDHMDEINVLSEPWTMVDYPENGIYSDFKC